MLKDGQAFHAWIMKMTVNMVRDRLRHRRLETLSRDVALPGSDDGSEWQLPDQTPGHDALVIASELTARIQQALLKLSLDHRTVVVLHYLEGLAVEDISVTLHVPVGTVKSRLARARAELRRHLADYLGSSSQ